MLKVSDYRYGNNEYLYARKSGVLNKLEAVCGKDIRDLVLSYVSNSYAPTLYYWNVFCDDTVPEDTKAQLRSEVDECIKYTCTGKSSHNSIDFWNIEMQNPIKSYIKTQPITKLLAWTYIGADTDIKKYFNYNNEEDRAIESPYRPAAIYKERGDIKILITGIYQVDTNNFIEMSCDGVLPSIIWILPTRTLIEMCYLENYKNKKITYMSKKYEFDTSKHPVMRYRDTSVKNGESAHMSDIMLKNAIARDNPYYLISTNITGYIYECDDNPAGLSVVGLLFSKGVFVIHKKYVKKIYESPEGDITNKTHIVDHYRVINGRLYKYMRVLDNKNSDIVRITYYAVDLEVPDGEFPPIIEIDTPNRPVRYTDASIKSNNITLYYNGAPYTYTRYTVIKTNETIKIPINHTHNFVIPWNAAGYYDQPVIQRRE
jgi:hypothetical protein